MYLNCTCEDGSVPSWFLNQKTGRTRFALLSCRKCGGGSDMGNGQKPDEVPITEAQYEDKRRETLQKAA